MSDPSDDRASTLQQLVDRTKMWLAGITHYGRRDLYALFGYNRWPRQLDFAARYLRQDIAKRIVDAPILACWADPPDLEADTAFIDAWDNLLEQVPIFHNLIRLDKLSALGSYAGMVIGIDDGEDLDKPVKPGGSHNLLYLQPYAEMALKVTSYDRNEQSPRFGKPVMYAVQPGRFTPNIRVGGITAQYTSEDRTPFNCHYSRLLHVSENLLEDSVFGRSRLEVVNNLLDDILKVAGGGAETFWLTANRGMQVDVDKEMELDAEDAADLSKEIEEYHHDMRRFIRTRGVKINELGSKVADPSGIADLIFNLISCATGIPKMVLIGSTTGQMASQQDRASWAERVTERITEYEEPVVFLPFINTLVNMGVLPQPQGLVINWQEAFKLSPLERSMTSAQMARSASNLTNTIAKLRPAAATKVTKGKDGSTMTETTPPPEVDPLFSRDEMRNIVGFGKRMPVFDGTSNSPSAGSQPSTGDRAVSTSQSRLAKKRAKGSTKSTKGVNSILNGGEPAKPGTARLDPNPFDSGNSSTQGNRM